MCGKPPSTTHTKIIQNNYIVMYDITRNQNAYIVMTVSSKFTRSVLSDVMVNN